VVVVVYVQHVFVLSDCRRSIMFGSTEVIYFVFVAINVMKMNNNDEYVTYFMMMTDDE